MTGTAAASPAIPPAAVPRDASTVSTAVLLATAPGAGGGPAALLRCKGGTLLVRLAGQLRRMGIDDIRVLTRPAWQEDVGRALDAAGDAAGVHASPSLAADLRILARIAEEPGGALALLPAETFGHGQGLAALLTNPSVRTGVLTTRIRRARHLSFKIRVRRSRVISAGSPYHRVHRPTRWSLGVLKVAAADRHLLAEVAARVAEPAAEPSAEWVEELEDKRSQWHAALRRAARNPQPEPERERDAAVEGLEAVDLPDEVFDEDPLDGPEAPAGDELSAEDEERLSALVAGAREDAVALLVVALIRAGAAVGQAHLRGFVWSRPLSDSAVEATEERLRATDEDELLLRTAVKPSDGFFTTFFVSPYSRRIARWAATKGLTPNQVTSVSLIIGVVAAAAFATGERWGLVSGAVLLHLAFVADCVDGQLARFTRTFSSFGGWLDSIFDRTKEYIAYAGLAIGASRSGDPAWFLACCAITLQTVRHMGDFSSIADRQEEMDATAHPPIEEVRDTASTAWHRRRAARAGERASATAAAGPRRRPSPVRTLLRRWHAIDRLPALVWIKKMIAFPIGERFAVIAITAALFSPRVAFLALLSWGAVAYAYTMSGRVLRSLAARNATARLDREGESTLLRYRDDGPLARALAGVVQPLLPAGSGLALLCLGLAGAALAAALTGDDPSLVALGAALAWLIVLAAASRARPPLASFRWAPAPLVRLGEYGALLWIGTVHGPGGLPATFALLGVLAFRHYDAVYRSRARRDVSPPWLDVLAAGWEGRLVIAFALLAAGALEVGMFVWAAALGVVFVLETALAWRGHGGAAAPDAELEDDTEAVAG
jgi:hypothetical protein